MSTSRQIKILNILSENVGVEEDVKGRRIMNQIRGANSADIGGVNPIYLQIVGSI